MNSGLECRESMCNLAGMETVDCQGFQLSPYAADLAEREGIDVRLIKRMLNLSPRERIEGTSKKPIFQFRFSWRLYFSRVFEFCGFVGGGSSASS